MNKIFAWGIAIQVTAILIIWLCWLIQAWVEVMF